MKITSEEERWLDERVKTLRKMAKLSHEKNPHAVEFVALLNEADKVALRDLSSVAFQLEIMRGMKIPKSKIPTGMALQKSLSKTGGQMHFKNGGGKKKPKSLSAKKTNKRVKKKGGDNLMTFGVKLPSVRTLEDMVK